MKSFHWLGVSLACLGLFVLLGILFPLTSRSILNQPSEDRVVMSAPVLLLMYAGDRFLAADLEVMRLAATTSFRTDRETSVYLSRAHLVAAQLNACHEDNYYLGNGLLTWGGMDAEGNDLLERATQCRFWDEIPPYLAGFNQYFFYRNIDKATSMLQLAADRSPENAATLQKLAIMIKVEQMDDDKMALAYLAQQIESTRDPKLKQMLEKRLVRLQGLVELRRAQQRYEKQTGKKLERPDQLISSGILDKYPSDPMRLGYEFVDGKFRLRQLKILGMENKQ